MGIFKICTGAPHSPRCRTHSKTYSYRHGRYARMNNKPVTVGHSDGFLALGRILEACMRLGVRCVTAYAFAIENFRRSEDEVKALMDLAEEKLLELSQHGGLLEQYGIRLNILGRKEILPQHVRDATLKVEEMTRHNDKAMLNICMPYAARDDMTNAVQTTVREAQSPEAEITEDDVSAHIMTAAVGSPPLDILIRTSGVKRLSDFMLWQCCENTQLQFSNTYWPEFGLSDFIPIILDYQRKVWAQDNVQ